MLCWSFIFGGSFWVQQVRPEKTLESPPRGLSPRWNRTWSIGRLWDAPLCNLLLQGRWARNLYLLLTLASKKHHQSPRWDCFPHHEKMGALFHAGKTKPQLLCGIAASEYSGPWPCPPTRGQRLTRSRGFVCGWMGTPLGRPIQTVKWDSRWPVSHPLLPVNPEGCWLSPRTEVREVILPSGDGKVSSQRGPGWPELVQITIWPSWSYPACWFCYRDCRVEVVLFRGISSVLTQARGIGS